MPIIPVEVYGVADKKTRMAMPEQDSAARIRNFDEVALGYDNDTAIEEAKRCLHCKRPRCVEGCPVNVNIPQFIEHIKQGDFEGAYQAIQQTNSLPAVCGRVCPQEEQCEKLCVLGAKGNPIAIGGLERFAADYHMRSVKQEKPAAKPAANAKHVAVVGAGPAGLTAAGDLSKLGYHVTIFEALHVAGGVLSYGIPEFRLPKAIVQQEIKALQTQGVELVLNAVVGKSITIDELFSEGYEAIFVGSGAGLPKFMGIPGESLNNVYAANEYLTRINLMKAYDSQSATPIKKARNIVVIGGGNVAMDAARCALRMEAENVTVVYRRSMQELPARLEEVHHAQQEGIIFKMLTNPAEIIGDESGWVQGIRCVEMELGQPDESGRRSPVEIPGSEFEIQADMVIMAIGTSPNPLIASTTPGLEIHRWGGIVVQEETMLTTKPGVYAGGDATTGAATVILAMGAGKRAAHSIHQLLSQTD